MIEMAIFPFFFVQWETRRKEEQLSGVELGFNCNCRHKIFNIKYYLKKHYLFWFIPLGNWKVDDVFLQCVKCGQAYELDNKSKDTLIELYYQAKEQEEKNES